MTLWEELRALMPGPLPARFPASMVVLFPPRDNAAQALQLLVTSLKVSANASMFTYTDKTLHAALKTKGQLAGFDLKLVLDETEAKQVPAMAALVTDWNADPRVLAGNSEHGDYIHRKILVGDHEYVVDGATNWTHAGEALEDNSLTIIRSKPLAAYYEQMLDANFARVQALKRPADPAAT